MRGANIFVQFFWMSININTCIDQLSGESDIPIASKKFQSINISVWEFIASGTVVCASQAKPDVILFARSV